MKVKSCFWGVLLALLCLCLWGCDYRGNLIKASKDVQVMENAATDTKRNLLLEGIITKEESHSISQVLLEIQTANSGLQIYLKESGGGGPAYQVAQAKVQAVLDAIKKAKSQSLLLQNAKAQKVLGVALSGAEIAIEVLQKFTAGGGI